MAKAFARQFYSCKAWQTCREAYAKSKQYLCEDCLRKGIYRPGEIVHHKIEIDPVTIERPEVALCFDNLELLCRVCHSKRHPHAGRWDKVNRKRKEERAKQRRYVVGDDGKVFAK